MGSWHLWLTTDEEGKLIGQPSNLNIITCEFYQPLEKEPQHQTCRKLGQCLPSKEATKRFTTQLPMGSQVVWQGLPASSILSFKDVGLCVITSI